MSWSSFWEGVSSIFDLSGQSLTSKFKFKKHKSEGEALSDDWKKLCQDFNRVAGKKVIGKKK